MSSKYQYPQLNIVGDVDNEDGNIDLVAVQPSDLYIFIEKLTFSVYDKALDSGGKFRVQDTLGNYIYTVNADATKDISLNFGNEGLRIGPGVGIQAIVYGANVTNASVSVALIGHLSFQG